MRKSVSYCEPEREGRRPFGDSYHLYSKDCTPSEEFHNDVTPPSTIERVGHSSWYDIDSDTYQTLPARWSSRHSNSANPGSLKVAKSVQFREPVITTLPLSNGKVKKGTDKVIWETHRVTLTKIQGLGFGIAVSGGRDNPHFSNGDPSIAISDVLKAGPAENKLHINDRVVSVNGVNLENVEHTDAIRLLRDSGNVVDLVIKRKILVPNPLDAQPTKVILQKRNKRDDYGIVLGCKFYVKEIVSNSLAAFDGAIKEGDTILKINNIGVESLSLLDAKRQVEKSKEKLHLTLKKPPRAPSVTNLLHKRQNSDIDYTKFQAYKVDNVYQPTSQHEKPDYEKPSINAFVQSTEQLSPYRSPYNSHNHYRTPDQSMLSTSLNTMDLSAVQAPLYESRDYFDSDTRYVSYNKEGGGAGLRIAGGNHTGIFIAGVQDGSPAQREGVREGDEIIKIDGHSARGMTKEEAVLRIMSLEEQVNLVLQYRYDEYNRELVSTGSDSGDSFHIRVHMTYEAPKGSNHMSFKPGDIFRITDTLRAGVIGEWNVVKLNEKNEEVAKGVIPNKSRAETLYRPKDDRDKPGRGSIFRRKSQKRSKSLGRDHWEDVIFAKEVSKHPVYERVVLKEPGFRRPVVIYGGVADICRSKLLQEVPELFDVSSHTETDKDDSDLSKTGIIKLGSIRSVLDRNKHCVLDVVPSAVDKLNYAQYYPIVINIHTDKKEVVKDVRACWSSSAAKSAKKMFEQAQKIEKNYPHIFTNTIELKTHEDWFKLVRDTVAQEQVQAIWMSEQRPIENLADDFLFPMANRLSSYGGHESDYETSRISDQYGATLERGMHRASSDPNIDQPNEAPPYPEPPQYIRPPDSGYQSDHPFSIYSPPASALHNTSHSHRRHRRERFKSDSRVPYHSTTYDNPGYPTSPTSIHPTNGRPTAMERLKPHPDQRSDSDYSADSGGHRNSHYMSPRNTKVHDPYKFTRMTSHTGSGVKSKPAPPVRSDSIGSSTARTAENPYGYGHGSSRRRLHHSTSYDPANVVFDEQKMRNYESRSYHGSGLTRQPSAPVSHYSQPQTSNHTVTPSQSRTNGHYAVPSLMSTSAPSDDNVFHATPVNYGGTSSFSNQLYMDSTEASDFITQEVQQETPKTSSSFESYKRFVTNKPFYGAKKELSRTKSTGNDVEPSAFESYNKKMADTTSGNVLSVRRGSAGALQPSMPRVEMEPTPENHTLLDTVSGVFDSSGGILNSPSTGVSIYIPVNAIPPGVKQEIYFKVCQQDDSVRSALDKTKGETLLSPLVMCGPHGLQFQLPIELRLPHNTADNPDNWSFSLKSSSDTAEKDNWQSVNISSTNDDSGKKNSVAVLVDHF